MTERANGAETLEQGDLFFLYRPKVERDDAGGLDDVERLHVVLRPQGRPLWRLLVMGAKRMPGLASRERNWGFVDAMLRHEADVRGAFAAHSYETKTRGTRHLAPARPAGEGVYALVRRGSQVLLACRLELPATPGPVQEALGTVPEAVYALQVKNPEAPGAALLGEGHAHLPKRVQAGFEGRRYEGESAASLDHEGVEFLLIGVEAAADGAPDAADESARSSDLLGLLGARRDRIALEPLISGVWA